MFRFSFVMVLCWPLPLIAADPMSREEVVPLAAWSFDESQGATAGDSSGRHPGKIVGAQWCEGRKGSALQFDGMDDFVDCGGGSESDERVHDRGLGVSAESHPAQHDDRR